MLRLLLLASVPYALTVERLPNPVGIDAPRPRLSWRLPEGMAKQAAYDIKADGWRSRKVLCSDSHDIPWGGPPLRDSQRVTWQVCVWDEAGRVTDWSAPATFTMGIVSTNGWQAKWIGPNPKTCPNVALGGAWCAGRQFETTFERGTDYACELVLAATHPFSVMVGDRLVLRTEGSVYDYRHLRFLDLAPYAQSGTNRLSITLYDDSVRPEIVRVARPGVMALRAALRDSRGVRCSSDHTWGGAPLKREDAAKLDAAIDFREELATPSFERRFAVGPNLRRATLHVTGLGFYEAFLNGQKIGRKVLDPSPTDYNRRVLYSTYILDELLHEGEQTLRIDLGHGWYDMRSISTWNFDSAPWRDRPKTIAQLELEYADGRCETVVTDRSWTQVPSATLFDCVREGEIRGLDRDTVALPLPAAEVAPPRGRLQCEALPPAVVAKTFEPKSIRPDGADRWIVTFPESIAGWVRCDFRGLKRGDEVAIRYDENLSEKGGVCEPVKVPSEWMSRGGERLIDMYYQATGSGRRLRQSGADMQVDHYVAIGSEQIGAPERFEPRFVYHGFRHVVLSGLREAPRREDVRACLVRTAFEETGSFECSDIQLTELVRMALNSYKANFTTGFPTDCPHREKLGWTGDAWIASELGQLYFENTAAYEKWLNDVIDTQRADGSVSCIVPTSGWGYHWGNGPTFDAVLGMLPWNLWRFRGDRRAVETAYPALRRYLANQRTRETSPDLVANGLDDWKPVNPANKPSREFVVSCVYLRLREVAAEFAALLGHAAEATEYREAAARTRRALREKYYRGHGVYDNGGQTAQALAIMNALEPQADREAMGEGLVEAFKRTGYHVDCGLMGSKCVYRALSETGHGEVALKALLNPTAPSMTQWLGKNGTLWEDWGKGESKCHVMLGDFAAWVMEYVAGIRRPDAPGYAHLTIAPTCIGVPTPWCNALRYSRGVTCTPYGRVVSEWSCEGGVFRLHVEIPSGTTATIKMPDGTARETSSGKHDFMCSLTRPDVNSPVLGRISRR